jgi:hypothetical protein
MDELWNGMDLEGIGHALIQVLYRELVTEDRGIPQKPSVNIANIRAGIRTGCVPNTILESYRYAKRFGDSPLII